MTAVNPDQPAYGTLERADQEGLESLIYTALGAASACWDDLDKAGQFRSDRAHEIGIDLLQRIRRRIAEGDANGGTERDQLLQPYDPERPPPAVWEAEVKAAPADDDQRRLLEQSLLARSAVNIIERGGDPFAKSSIEWTAGTDGLEDLKVRIEYAGAPRVAAHDRTGNDVGAAPAEQMGEDSAVPPGAITR